MIRKRIHIITFLFVLLLIGCQRTPTSPDPENDVTLSLVFDTRHPTQHALVTRVMGNNEFGNLYINEAVLSTGESTFNNVEKQVSLLDKREYALHSDFNYSAEMLVRPGSTYEVQLKTEETTITGTTTVPDTLGVQFNTEDQLITWHDDENTAMYIVNIYAVRSFGNLEPVSTNNVVFDTLYQVSDDEWALFSHFSFEVIAFDRNYYQHAVQGKNQVGISGGRGVVASIHSERYRYWPPHTGPLGRN